jgi:sulfate/thiosulfate transport system substrate-binding protein
MVAAGYLDLLFSPAGQQIIAKHAFRPRGENLLARLADPFPSIKTSDVDAMLRSWAEVQKSHFTDGGIYDQMIMRK